jgi:hypothetical protein
VERLNRLGAGDPRRGRCQDDLDDLFAVLQVFCYGAGDNPRRADGDHLAAALDHLEEDLLGAPVAAPRAARSAVLTFGRPVVVDPVHPGRSASAALTRALEERVQALLDGPPAPGQGEWASPCRTTSTSVSQ